jgi:hypothetical protein
MYAMLPDLPAKNPEMSYLNILLSMGKFAVTEPVRSAFVAMTLYSTQAGPRPSLAPQYRRLRRVRQLLGHPDLSSWRSSVQLLNVRTSLSI